MDSIINTRVPFTEPIPGGVQVGRMMRINGRTTYGAASFSVSLQAMNGDIALYLSPILNGTPPRVARNSLQGGVWGTEEADGPYFPFSPDQDYEILILPEGNHFKIAINGQHFAEFYYRIPITSISHLAVQGDTIVHSVKMEGGSGGSVVPPPIPTAPGMPAASPFVKPPGSPQMPHVPPVGGPYVPPAAGAPYVPPGGGAPYVPPPGGNPYPAAAPYPGAYPPGGSYYPQQPPPPPYSSHAYPSYPQSGHSSTGGGIVGKALGAVGATGLASSLLGGNKHNHSGYPGYHQSTNPLDKAASFIGARGLTSALSSGGKNLLKGKFKLI